MIQIARCPALGALGEWKLSGVGRFSAVFRRQIPTTMWYDAMRHDARWHEAMYYDAMWHSTRSLEATRRNNAFHYRYGLQQLLNHISNGCTIHLGFGSHDQAVTKHGKQNVLNILVGGICPALQ